MQRYNVSFKIFNDEQNFLISEEKQLLQASNRRFAGRSVCIVAMGSHLFCHHRSLMSRTQRQAPRLSMGLDRLGLHSARGHHCDVILAHCVAPGHFLHREWVTLQPGRVSHRPRGLSRVQQCEREWRCLVCECEQRCLECEHECRLAPGNLANRRTTMGTCPRCSAEGNEPQQKHLDEVESWNIKCRAMEFGRSATIRRSLARERKALIFHTEKTMHREGYIMQEVTSYGNMSEAFVTI